jgi:hypothetical protein
LICEGAHYSKLKSFFTPFSINLKERR